jgi:deoxyribodipyrimidine photo-lyase
MVHGHAGDAVPRLAAELSVDAVFASHDDEPQSLTRDAAVQAALEGRGVAFTASRTT